MYNIFLSAIIAIAFTQHDLIYTLNVFYIFIFLLILALSKLKSFTPSVVLGVALLSVADPILVSVLRTYSNQLTSLSPVILCYILSVFTTMSIDYRQLSLKKIIASTLVTGIMSIVYIDYLNYDRYTLFFLCVFSSFSILYISNIFSSFVLIKSNKFEIFIVIFFIIISLYPLHGFSVTKNIALVESQWCITTCEYDNDYTMKSAYSYSEMKKLLSHKYKLHWVEKYKNLESALTSSEVLIMLTPTQPFSTQQIEGIRSFVSRGGRLVAVADHTDLYGHAATLNAVLSPYGLKINFDSIFAKSKPMVRSRFDRFSDLDNIFLKTPCSVSMFRPGHVWAKTPHSLSERGDYSKPNFFGDLEWTADDGLSNWPIGVTVPYGKGEVSVFCDSTIFANFALFQPYNLEILEGIISGGQMSSRGAFWGFWFTLGACVFILIFPNYKFLNVPVACLLIFLLSGFNHSEPNCESLYPSDKTINVYGDCRYIVEPPPNAIPSSDTISSLYAHIARSGLYPRYIGKELPKEIYNNTLLVAKAEKVIGLTPPKNSNLLKIIIVDKILQDNPMPFSAFDYGMEASQEFINFFPIHVTKRTAFQNESYHSIKYNGISCVSAFGALSDRVVGNWWINTEISPYRRAILNDFYGWLRGENEIRVFQYPAPAHISQKRNGARWEFTTGKGQHLDFFGHIQKDKKFIYLGSGIWGLHSFYEGKEYLLGGPELIDDSYSILDIHWAAVSKEE